MVTREKQEKDERKRGANKTGKLVKGERGKREANGEVGERKTGGKWRIMEVRRDEICELELGG